ncbi:MAG: hypothetical protein LBS50_00005 [Prevotellaceae bacterium]|jgi:hypothetical protein|nr:hypothetical protein [Prevotellaceae bacterium]
MFQELYNIKKGRYYLFLTVMTVIFAYFTNIYLSKNLWYNILQEQFTTWQINLIMQKVSAWQYFGYPALPFIILIRVFYTAFGLYVGNLFQEYKWEWKQLFNIALKADIVFLFAAAIGFCYYVFVNPPQTLDDINVNFVSVLALIGHENVSNWLMPAYNVLNLFELLYIIVLTTFISQILKLKYWKSFLFVVICYGLSVYFYIAALLLYY